MVKSPKKLIPMHRLCDKLADARAIATTIELALAGIDADVVNDDASDVRAVALMLRKRLRKLEAQIGAHDDLNMQKMARP